MMYKFVAVIPFSVLLGIWLFGVGSAATKKFRNGGEFASAGEYFTWLDAELPTPVAKRRVRSNDKMTADGTLEADTVKRRQKRDNINERCNYGSPIHIAYMTCYRNYLKSIEFVQQLLDPNRKDLKRMARTISERKFQEVIALLKSAGNKSTCHEFFLFFSCMRTRLACASTLFTAQQLADFQVEFMLTFSRCNEMKSAEVMERCAQPLFRNTTCSSSRVDMGLRICRSQYLKCRDRQLFSHCEDVDWRARITFCQLNTYLIGGCLFTSECSFIGK